MISQKAKAAKACSNLNNENFLREGNVVELALG